MEINSLLELIGKTFCKFQPIKIRGMNLQSTKKMRTSLQSPIQPPVSCPSGQRTGASEKIIRREPNPIDKTEIASHFCDWCRRSTYLRDDNIHYHTTSITKGISLGREVVHLCSSVFCSIVCVPYYCTIDRSCSSREWENSLLSLLMQLSLSLYEGSQRAYRSRYRNGTIATYVMNQNNEGTTTSCPSLFVWNI